MKLHHYLSLLFMGGMVCSCSDDIFTANEQSSESMVAEWHYISPDKAISIANAVLTRSGNEPSSRSMSIPTIEYVTQKVNSRSSLNEADTLAYIINYPNDEGFVIVSSDDRVYPVLAFSHSNNFTFDNEISQKVFIDRIQPYIDSADADNSYALQTNDFRISVNVDTIITKPYYLDQGAPFNKYVVQNKGNYPVGCVAVATAYVTMFSKDSVRYRNDVFHFKSIKRGIGIRSSTIRPSRDVTLVGLNEPRYNYDQAIDKLAWYLYVIGTNINMQYGYEDKNQSAAYTTDAYDFIRYDLGYTVTELTEYNASDIAQYLTENYIIYLTGDPYIGKYGHDWVCDGCLFRQSASTGEKTGIYLHCDWGWGGKCNGYFTGEIFQPYPNTAFEIFEYFGVKREF